MVDLRSLKGSKRAPENSNKSLETGQFISDIKDQLEPLPFSHYETLSHERQLIPLHEKGVIRLGAADKTDNKIFVDLDCINSDGARVLVDWQNDDGQSLLTTKLHLLNGKSWVIGTDHEDDSSTIISIKVDCKP